MNKYQKALEKASEQYKVSFQLQMSGETSERYYYFKDTEEFQVLKEAVELATPEWKPEYGETYYMPALQYPVLYNRSPWENSAWDNHRWDNHLVYKTEEEAVEVSKRMLKALKEEQYDG